MQSFCQEKKNILKFRDFFIDDKNKIEIKFHLSSNKILCKVNNINNLEDIRKYTGKLISIDRNQLPKLNNDNFYYNDLIKTVAYVKKNKIGVVNDVKNHGAGDYLEILTDQKEILVPLNDSHVDEINLEKGIIFLSPVYYEI